MSISRQAQYARGLRAQIVKAYGGECACCGETRFHFLTLDHKNNDGVEHRKRLRRDRRMIWKSKHRVATEGSVPFWNDLKRRGYPKDDYQILCYNCNCGRHRNWENPGICPHELERGVVTSRPLQRISIFQEDRQPA